jgi:hypothetical protein
MDLEEYRIAFAVGSIILILVAAVPTLSLVLSFPEGKAQFSEFWVLGTDHMMHDYPFDVKIDQPSRVFVGVRNHMGSTLHYMVYVKFRNQTQLLPDPFNLMPSSLPSLYEYHVFLQDSETWENQLTFSILGASRIGNSTLVSEVSINDVVFSVNSSAMRDTERNGYYYQMFLELWFYNTTSMRPQFHNRFVGFWLNMTGELPEVPA